MPIGEPMVVVECDNCGQATDPIDITLLAGGVWDTRNVPSRLKRWGWTIEGEKTICEECSTQERAQTRGDDSTATDGWMADGSWKP